MFRKTPEEVVEERHSQGFGQAAIEHCTRTREEKKEMVHMHIVNFFYECGIPFKAANSRSYEIMVESIGQFGPRLKPPTYHELRLPLFEKAKKEMDELKETHENAWKRYGCTLMLDTWTDRRDRHLINFLVNSLAGTFFLDSIDASSQSEEAMMLADMLEKKIEEIGKDKVVQVVTDNCGNYKAVSVVTPELQSLALRINGLCCSFSGCERNWNTFECIHTKRRNRLEQKRLNVRYNKKIAHRSQKWREGGTNFNPLIIENFWWNNEWIEVVHLGKDLLQRHVDEVIGALNNLEGHNLPMRSCVDETTGTPNTPLTPEVDNVYSRCVNSTSTSTLRLIDEEDVENEQAEPFPNWPNDDEDVEDDYAQIA